MENGQMFPINDSNVKVLVVDDHPNTANMLARAISRLGTHVEVVSATSGLEAIKHVEDGVADILITDMMMPEMTGIELIEMLNDQPSTSPSVTYLLTAHDSSGVREVARQLNVRDVIAKPVNPEWICELVSKTIDELKSSQTLEVKPALHNDPRTVSNAEPKQEDLNVARLVWEVAKKFQPQADLKDQLLVVGKTATESTIRGNTVKLRQALRNLVWSAIKNTPNGGTVILSSENEADMVKIIVRDTGYGITAEQSGYVDNPDYDQTIYLEGKDQDLMIVKSIAEQHGGDVTVESEAGKGTCFTLRLPIAQPNLLPVKNKTFTGTEIRSVQQ